MADRNDEALETDHDSPQASWVQWAKAVLMAVVGALVLVTGAVLIWVLIIMIGDVVRALF